LQTSFQSDLRWELLPTSAPILNHSEKMFNSFITASSVTSIRAKRYILFGGDGIFYMHFNSLIMSIRQ